MKKNKIKRIFLSACIVFIACVGVYFYHYLKSSYTGISKVLEPKVSEGDISHAKQMLNEITNLTVYDSETYRIANAGGELISNIVDLSAINSKIRSFSVDQDTVKKILSKAKYRPEFVIWKGDKLGIAKLKNGEELKIRISFYGGFFSILGIEGFYEFEGEDCNKWEEAVNFSKFNND